MNKTRHSTNRTNPFRYFLFLLLGFALIFNSFSPSYSALAAFSFPLSETFMGATASGWVLGGAPASAILTSGGADPAGNGWLRLTNANTYQAGFAYYNTPIPTGRGLVITFDYASWGGSGADGLSFFLFDGTTTTFNVGASGGSLGYAQKTGVNGLSNGYLGLGLDEFGNYSNPNEGRSGGIGAFKESVAIRGPGSGTKGYAYLAGTKTLTPTYPRLDCPKNNGSCGNGTARPPDAYYYRQVQITLIPVGAAYQVSVAMKFSKTDASWTTLFGPFTMPTSAPSTLKMGFAASTGGSTNFHEIRNLNVSQQVPDLTATKAVQNATTGGGSVAPGNQLQYNVVLSNHTGADITGVHFTDAIPANTTYVDNSATVPSGSTLNTTSPTLDITGITIPANGQASLSFKVQVVTPIPIGVTQISNQGTFTYGTTTSQTDGDAVTDGSQATTISVTAGPNFDTSTKTVAFQDKDGNGAVSPGDILTYQIVLSNSGNQNSPTTLFSDVLPSNTTYVTASAAPSSGTVSYSTTTKTLSWTVSVDAGSQASLSFNVTVNAGVLIRDIISNQGSVTFGTTTVLTDADLASPGKQPTQLLVGGLATLTAVKTASVVSSPLLPNGELLYSIVLTNPSGFAILGATFADSIPANTTYVAASLSSTSGTATYTAPSINVSGISVAANGGTVTISFKVKLDSLATGGVTQISNQGLVSWDSNQSGSNNTTLQTDGDASTVGQQPTLTNIPNADLSITKTVDNINPAEADEITYTLRVVNNGPLDASSVLAVDAVPSGLTYLSASATSGSYNNTTGQWSIGSLANGASATLSLHATVNVGQGGSEIPNTASVSSAYYDAVPANNTAGASLTVKTTSLSGVVTDSDSGAVLANTGIKITDAQGHICTTNTDSNGLYTFTSGQNGCLLSPGTATVETTSAPVGSLLQSTSKTITSGGVNTQDFALVRPSLSGVVTDLGPGVPIVGAQVHLTQPASGADCTATTTAGGAYSFTAGTGSPVCTFIPGEVTVVASASRYQSNTQTPSILSTGPTVLNLTLGTVDLLINKSDGVPLSPTRRNLELCPINHQQWQHHG